MADTTSNKVFAHLMVFYHCTVEVLMPPYQLVPTTECPRYVPLKGWRKWAAIFRLPIKRECIAFFSSAGHTIHLNPANVDWMRKCLDTHGLTHTTRLHLRSAK